jgi:sugar phosphate isomerase/epimerase
MTHPFAGIALHTWTLDTTPLAQALATIKAAGYDAVELRRVDFKRCFDAGQSNAQVLDLVRETGLKVSAVGVEYGWMFAKGDESQRLFSVFRQQCENAIALDCPLMMSALGAGEGSIEDAAASVRTAGHIAAELGLRVTLEYQFQHPIVNSLDLLRDIIARAARPNVGLLLDAYHLQRGGLGAQGFGHVRDDEIFYVQYSDVPDAPPNATPPTDRLAPGRGVVDWTALLRLLADKGYRGYLSYEGPNVDNWTRPAHDVANEGLAATRAVLRRAFDEKTA